MLVKNNDNNILDNLKNSELPLKIYNYLASINKIIACDNTNDLFNLYNNLKDTKVYDSEIPLEPYLRGKYTEFYSQADESKKKQMFNMVTRCIDVTPLMQPKEPTSVKISL